MYEEFCAEEGIDEVPDLNSEPGREPEPSCRNCLIFLEAGNERFCWRHG
jgi:hypothetical protein